MDTREATVRAYVERFGEHPSLLVRAPGRVNLIGEHTDYNDGFVMPMAINRAVWIASRPRDDNKISLYSLDFDETISFDINDLEKGEHSATEYIKGVAWAMQEAGYTIGGFEGTMKGDVPIGSGLSSSAALELAAFRTFATQSHIEWDVTKFALLAQKVENKWLGVNSGIMDQLISAAGDEGHALLIDCRSLEMERFPLPPNTSIVVLDTGTRRKLIDNAYNERRAQCEAAAKHFGVDALRDVSIETFESHRAGLDIVVESRAKHVITENDRVMEAKAAMLAGDAPTLGKLLNASHISLRDDYEVSSDALNAIVEAAQAHDACYGARMTGAGFGGCAVALVDSAQIDDFVQQVEAAYTAATPHTPAIYVTDATAGAAVVST